LGRAKAAEIVVVSGKPSKGDLESCWAMSHADELKLQRRAAADAEREQGTRVDRNVIVHPDGRAALPEIPQSFLTVHSFAQGQPKLQNLAQRRRERRFPTVAEYRF